MCLFYRVLYASLLMAVSNQALASNLSMGGNGVWTALLFKVLTLLGLICIARALKKGYDRYMYGVSKGMSFSAASLRVVLGVALYKHQLMFEIIQNTFNA